MTLRDLRAPEDQVRLEQMLKALRRSEESVHLARHLKKDGTPIDVDVRGRPLSVPGRSLRLVVIMDVTFGGPMDGIEATRRIKEVSPETHVVVMTAHRTERLVVEALEAGALALLANACEQMQVLVAPGNIFAGVFPDCRLGRAHLGQHAIER